MKHLKILGLLAVVAAALMALAASASATTLTSPTGTTYTGIITAVNKGTVSLDGAFTTVTCTEHHLEGKVESHGAGKTVSGQILTHTLAKCNFPVTVNTPGTFEIHAVNEVLNSGGREIVACVTTYCTGTLTSTGTKVTIQTSVGNCVFTTNATDLGTLTPTNDTNGHPTIDTGGPEGKTGKVPRTEGNFLCGSSGQWTGAHTVTLPSTLWIDP